jgi:hypothetical protein
MEKLYIIVRNDLTPGLQCAQACHAQHLFTQRFPELTKVWEQNLVVLQVPNEACLDALYEDFAGGPQNKGEVYPAAAFFEPDLDDQMTAIAVAGTAEKLLSSFPLALRQAA